MAHDIVTLRERFHQLLDTLVNDYNLGKYIDGCCPEDLDTEWWDDYNKAAEHLGIWTGTGATKFVIGDDNCDYIIKFSPCNGDFDYCGREAEVYKEAEKAGHADKFAWCEYLFDYEFNDSFCLPVYVMEWCQCGYEMIDDEMDEYTFQRYCTSRGVDDNDDTREDYYNSEMRGEYQENMMVWAYSHWGLDYNAPTEGKSVAQFMREMFINDIHAGNWGWCNNRLVLVDYSGYGENFNARSILY